MLNNIVANLEQCGQQNIVQCCFHQARTGCAFVAVIERYITPDWTSVFEQRSNFGTISCQAVAGRLLWAFVPFYTALGDLAYYFLK